MVALAQAELVAAASGAKPTGYMTGQQLTLPSTAEQHKSSLLQVPKLEVDREQCVRISITIAVLVSSLPVQERCQRPT